MTLGEYVRRVMEAKHLSAMKVQQNSGGAISDTYVLKIKNGMAKRPSLSRLKALAKGLKQPEDEVLAVAGAEVERQEWSAQRLAAIVRKIADHPELGEIVELLAHMKSDEFKKIAATIKKKKE